MEEIYTEADEPHIKIVRPPTRRKFLTAILGSGVILGLGSPALMHLAQNAQVAFNAKDGPSDSDLELYSISTDLNLAAFVKSDHDGKLYIWNYQQQHMATLPPAQFWNASAWSPNSKYLFYQESQDSSSSSMNIWDIQAWQKVSSYKNEEYIGADMVFWSPDGSQIALFDKEQNKLFLMAAQPLRPLFTLDVPPSIETFAWSPDSQKIAFMIGSSDRNGWSVQIWDLQSRRKSQDVAFQGQVNFFYSNLAWSPDGTHIAAAAHGQLQIIQTESRLSSKLLDKNIQGKIAWSPDSKHLAFSGSEAADERGWHTPSFGSRFNVWSPSEKRKVWSYNAGANSLPRALGWSKDGHKITTIDISYSQENWDWPS